MDDNGFISTSMHAPPKGQVEGSNPAWDTIFINSL